MIPILLTWLHFTFHFFFSLSHFKWTISPGEGYLYPPFPEERCETQRGEVTCLTLPSWGRTRIWALVHLTPKPIIISPYILLIGDKDERWYGPSGFPGENPGFGGKGALSSWPIKGPFPPLDSKFVVAVQSLSHVWLFVTPVDCSMLFGFALDVLCIENNPTRPKQLPLPDALLPWPDSSWLHIV